MDDCNGLWIDGECWPWNDNELSDDEIIVPGDFFEPDNTDVPQIMNPKPEPNPLFNFKLPELNLTDKLLGLGVLWIVLSTKAWK